MKLFKNLINTILTSTITAISKTNLQQKNTPPEETMAESLNIQISRETELQNLRKDCKIWEYSYKELIKICDSILYTYGCIYDDILDFISDKPLPVYGNRWYDLAIRMRDEILVPIMKYDSALYHPTNVDEPCGLWKNEWIDYELKGHNNYFYCLGEDHDTDERSEMLEEYIQNQIGDLCDEDDDGYYYNFDLYDKDEDEDEDI